MRGTCDAGLLVLMAAPFHIVETTITCTLIPVAYDTARLGL